MSRLLIIVSLVCLTPLLSEAQDAGSPLPRALEGVPDAAATVAPPQSDPQPSAAPESITRLEPQPAPLEEAPLSAAELEVLGLNAQQGGVDTSLQFSGFADFSVASAFVAKDSSWRLTSAPPRTTAYVGNFNLYLKKNLTETLRTMGEVRFTYLPNGATDPITGIRTNTSAPDYNDYNRTLRWGGVEIERIYLEWTILPQLELRAGQFLTPYGIWNVDHGSPTYIPVQRPFVVGNNWFPERQTGFELFGRWDASGTSTIGYHLTLSNGTGPISEYFDLDENKAVGGRVYWEYHGSGELRLGASGYYGRETGASWAFAFQPDGSFKAKETIDTQFDSLAWAADASWKYRGWHLQTEWITYQAAFTDKGRTKQAIAPGAPTSYPPDSFSWGMYALAGYRFPWLGTMPFVVIEHIDGTLFHFLPVKNVTIQGGLNVRPVDVLTLKLVYYHVKFLEGLYEGEPLRMLQAQAAWAF